MRRVLNLTLATVAALAIASPALAGPTLSSTGSTKGTPDSYQVFGIANAKGGTNVVFGSSPNNSSTANVTMDSGVSNLVDVDIGNGAAIITPDKDNPADWTTFIINPDLPFTDMKWAVALAGSGTVNIYALLSGGSGADSLATYGTLNGSSNPLWVGSYSADGNDLNIELSGATFDSVLIQVTGSTLNTVKQISYEPLSSAVPEPATWGLMLLGFGGIGMAMRRRRKQSGALMQVA